MTLPFDRLPDQRWREPIGRALEIVGPWRHIIGQVRFICGVHPHFAGAHSCVEREWWSYGDIAHCAYPYHMLNRPRDEQVNTIFLPKPVSPEVVVHELGHALHQRLGFQYEWDSGPVSEYAKTNRWECFADYFMAHCGCDDGFSNEPGSTRVDWDAYLRDDLRERLDVIRR